MFRGLAVALWMALSCLTALAAPLGRWSGWDDRLFQRVTSATGEPNDLGVMAMAQDPVGFLWVGTQQGLVRWDGYRLRTYSADLSQPHGLPDGFIQSLWVAPEGTLWIGTVAHGLVRYRPHSDDFESVGLGPQGLRHVGVNVIAGAPQGRLWVGTGAGLDRLDPTTGRAERVVLNPGRTEDPAVQAVLTDRSGQLWIGSDAGLFRAAADGRGVARYPLPGTGDTPRISRLMEDQRGRLWIAVDHQGLWVLDLAQGSLRRVESRSVDAAAGLDQQTVRSLVESGDGQVWVGTRSNGLVLVDENNLTLRRIHRNATSAFGLDSEAIWSLFRDRSGILWVGTSRSLLRHNLQATFVHTVFGGDGPRDTLRSEDVLAVIPTPDGRIWLGVGTEGVDIVDPAQGVVATLRPDMKHPLAALPPERVLTGLPLEQRAEVLLGTQKGLYLADLAGTRVRRLEVPGHRSDEEVQVLARGWSGIWVGGPEGLWRLTLDRQGRPKGARPAVGMSDRRISAITRASPHRIWVGTNSGVNLYDERTGQVLHLGAGGRWQDATLASVNVTSLELDPKGRLWVATGGTGLFVVDAPESDHPQVRHLGSAQGLPKDFINKVLPDDLGGVWASTDQGIVQIDPATLAVRAYGAKDGVALLQYWAASGARTHQGELIFGGLGGLSVVVPQVIEWRTYQAPVVATEVWVGGQAQTMGRFNQPGQVTRLTLPPGQHDLAVEFAALDYLAPSSNRYAYRLDGYDEDWIPTDASRRRAAYTNLPPGEYRLELRGSNADGLWSSPPMVIDVEVQPAWFQRVGFRLLAALLGLALLWGMLRVRTLWLTRRQHELEQLVAERTAELEQRSAELQLSQAKLAEMAYFDALTGLPNRRMLAERFDRLASTVRREGEGGFALLLLDLDRFKQINDSLGHAAGDALLQAAAERLKQAVREVDTVARIGGDEFAILLSGLTDPHTIEPVCRRIVQAFERPVVFGDEPMSTSASIGVACYPTQGRTLDELSRLADGALYRAKAAGRNTWRFA